MLRPIRWQLSRKVLTCLAFGAASLSSCARSSAAPAARDLGGARVETLATLTDDQGALLALAADGDERAILSDTAPFVTLLARGSDPVRFGVAGDGPGELRFPSGLALEGSSISVWDPSSGRLSTYDQAGRLLALRTSRLASGKILGRILRDGYGNAGRIAATPSGVVVAEYAGAVRQHFALWSLALVRIRSDGSLDTLRLPFPPIDRMEALNEGARELVAVPLWASCGPRGLATWEPVGRMLRRYTASGTESRVDSVEGPTLALTDDVIKLNLRYQLDALLPGPRPDPAVYEQMIESMLEQSRGHPNRFPKTSPMFVSMQCDDDGTVWLQGFSLTDAGSGMGRTWTLVDTAGRTRAVRLPSDLKVLGIADHAVWGARTDTEGQTSLAMVSLPTE